MELHVAVDTYKHDFMIKYHRPITSTSICGGRHVARSHREYAFFFENGCEILVSFPDVLLACRQVTVQEAERCIVKCEACDDSSLDRLASSDGVYVAFR